MPKKRKTAKPVKKRFRVYKGRQKWADPFQVFDTKPGAEYRPIGRAYMDEFSSREDAQAFADQQEGRAKRMKKKLGREPTIDDLGF